MLKFRNAGVFLLLVAAAAFAAGTTETAAQDAVSIPQLINYQGKLTNASGELLNGTFQMTFVIFEGGTQIWTETQNNVQVTDGIFNVLLGAVTPITSLPEAGNCSLQVIVNTEPIAPKIPLVSVPYTYYARKADDADKLGGTAAAQYIKNGTTAGGDLDGTYPNPTVDGLQGRPVASTAPSAGQVLAYSGTQWQPQTISASLWTNSGSGYIYPNTPNSNTNVRAYGTGYTFGLYGQPTSNYCYGVYGYNTYTYSYGVGGFTGAAYSAGLYGYCNNNYSYGVYGFAPSYSYSYGVAGYAGASYSAGVYGLGLNSYTYGVYGFASSYTANYGVYGYGYYYGVGGYCGGYATWGVLGSYNNGWPCGVYGFGSSYHGVYGYSGSSSYYAIYGYGYYNAMMGYNGYYAIRGGLALYSPPCAVYGYANYYYGYYLYYVGSSYGNYSYNSAGYYTQSNYSSYKIYGSGTVSTYIIDANDRERALHCPEAPEVVFEDYGTGRLSSGYARVDIDPLFLRGVVINEEHPLRVYVTPTGTEPVPVSVRKGDTYFEVYGPSGSNVAFDWRIVANRAGYEHMRFESRERPADRRGKPEPTPANPWPEMTSPSVPVEPMPAEPQQQPPVPAQPEQNQ